MNRTFIEKQILGTALRDGALDLKWYTRWLSENDHLCKDKRIKARSTIEQRKHFKNIHQQLFNEVRASKKPWLHPSGRKIVALAKEELSYSYKTSPCDIMRTLMLSK